MRRTIVSIDQKRCNGCGACAKACHENAIAMGSDGKAHLVGDHFCDGMGDCLPACPAGAITITVREAEAYDADAVGQRKKGMVERASELRQWPIQIKLIRPDNPAFRSADLVVGTTCTGFAYPAFHQDFLKGKALVVGCPKLDGVSYSPKLAAILTRNDIKSVTLIRMEVPCCGGMVSFLQQAIAMSGKDIPLKVVTISLDGNIIGESQVSAAPCRCPASPS